jgi:uncharacterized protein (TIGR02246 family)
MSMKAASTDSTAYISYPTNRVVGTVADDGKARTAIDALLRAGFARQDIDILHDEKDLKRLDPTGSERGFLAQFQRTLIRALDLEQFKHLTHHVDDVRAGRFVIMVLAKRRAQRIVAADILHRHGADFVEFYGRWACEDLPSTAQRSPEEIPALFARAWNERDPDALAALFDEDAEFVNVIGERWHNRESIRKAHAYGLERIFNQSQLSIDETKVKLLSPGIAVVHARMTLSGQAAAGEVRQPGARTSIVSFVVHRIVDRWQCASAHHTHVIAKTATEVTDESGGFGWANYPSGQVS